MSHDVIYHLIQSQRALLDTIESQLKSDPKAAVVKDKSIPTILHSDMMQPEEEEFYVDYVEQERQALIREAAKSYKVKKEEFEQASLDTEEEMLEPVILPHIVDRMREEPIQSGRLDQNELMADLNI